ncbi:MAG: helix-turn-helix domain-containing protein, partial [Lactobacillus crispatus]|nr:helix-turn-helix domain-containing protein [Lactobacillus crispatus]
YYNATEACQFLGVSQATFWKWKKKYPELKPIMVDGICRFAREDLINFMNEKRK